MGFRMKDEVQRTKVMKLGQTVEEDVVYCPYCTEIQSMDTSFPIGTESEIQCHSCERHFMVKPIIKFSTRRLR